MATAIVAMVVLHVVTPTPDGIVGAARLITLWPALAANVLFFALWSWRVGRV